MSSVDEIKQRLKEHFDALKPEIVAKNEEYTALLTDCGVVYVESNGIFTKSYSLLTSPDYMQTDIPYLIKICNDLRLSFTWKHSYNPNVINFVIQGAATDIANFWNQINLQPINGRIAMGIK